VPPDQSVLIKQLVNSGVRGSSLPDEDTAAMRPTTTLALAGLLETVDTVKGAGGGSAEGASFPHRPRANERPGGAVDQAEVALVSTWPAVVSQREQYQVANALWVALSRASYFDDLTGNDLSKGIISIRQLE
jgi:hypothetical protein